MPRKRRKDQSNFIIVGHFKQICYLSTDLPVLYLLTRWLPRTYIYVIQAYLCVTACNDVNIRPSIEASHGYQGTAEYANVCAEAGTLVA